jgi:hypothetical protein
MKVSTNIFSRLTLVAIACTLVASAPINAAGVKTNPSGSDSTGAARLIVNRSANFGIDESINLFVDGGEVAILGYDESYNAPLPAGKHVLSISTTPETFPEGAPKRLAITAEPGKTYTFTAVWPDPERAGLIEN